MSKTSKKQSTKDMEFENYQDFIVNTIANIFAIQPDEIDYPKDGEYNE